MWGFDDFFKYGIATFELKRKRKDDFRQEEKDFLSINDFTKETFLERWSNASNRNVSSALTANRSEKLPKHYLWQCRYRRISQQLPRKLWRLDFRLERQRCTANTFRRLFQLKKKFPFDLKRKRDFSLIFNFLRPLCKSFPEVLDAVRPFLRRQRYSLCLERNATRSAFRFHAKLQLWKLFFRLKNFGFPEETRKRISVEERKKFVEILRHRDFRFLLDKIRKKRFDLKQRNVRCFFSTKTFE